MSPEKKFDQNKAKTYPVYKGDDRHSLFPAMKDEEKKAYTVQVVTRAALNTRGTEGQVMMTSQEAQLVEGIIQSLSGHLNHYNSSASVYLTDQEG